MKDVKVNQSVLLPGNRTGIVVEVDQQNRTALCSLDHKDKTAGGATKRAWYGFDDLSPLTAFPRRQREDAVQAARRVVDEATGERPKTRPPKAKASKKK